MRLRRIDAFEVNYADSATRKELKLKTKGMGEARIYVGHDEEKYDEFFEFDKIEYFFSLKTDLLKYLEDSKTEYFQQSQDYKFDISKYYDENLTNTKNINKEKIMFKFRKTYDKQNRYYLVIEEGRENRKNYNYIRNICLPRVTKLCFVKVQDTTTNKKYIYMKPIFFNDAKIKDETVIIVDGNNENKVQKTYRKKQNEYRQELLNNMPFCPFTMVTDDRILVACHIKPFSACEEHEKHDIKNGIVMTPTYHVLFDAGLISFKDDGTLLISPFLSNITKKRLCLKENQIIRLQHGSEKYLEYHRKNIFNQMPNIEDLLSDND